MLKFVGISKGFAGVQALQDVSFEARPGEVHALCGENGAGKSTLLKVLSGVHLADAGTLEVDGKICRFASADAAIEAGISVIYQELNLVPELSVAENIWLGHLPHKGPFVDRATMRDLAQVSLNQVGLDVDPGTKLGRLSLAQKQMVEIAKALSRKARIIAFDEPTSSLSSREAETLFSIIGDLRKKGMAMLYVSHRMAEVQRICDACTVLRDGKHVETFETLKGVTTDTIISRMVGREVTMERGTSSITANPGLKVSNVTGRGIAEPANLEVRKGEIVGIFGLIGAGRSELLKAIYEGEAGEVKIEGKTVQRERPMGSLESGLVLCPEDRKKEGIIPLMSVAENINLSMRRKFAKLGFWLDVAREQQNAIEMIGRLRVKTASPKTNIVNLSGGNQQKAILARWLAGDVKVVLLDEPTRGIDIGAKSEIHQIARDLASKGTAVLFVSSELPEVLALADRILVMREGRITAEFDGNTATEEALLKFALPEAV